MPVDGVWLEMRVAFIKLVLLQSKQFPHTTKPTKPTKLIAYRPYRQTNY